MIKLALFDVDEKEQAVLSKAFAGENAFELSFYQKPLDVHTSTMAKDADGIGIFIQSQITQEVLDLLPHLKIIATMSTCFDHIDLEACKARNITVCNNPRLYLLLQRILEVILKMWSSILQKKLSRWKNDLHSNA